MVGAFPVGIVAGYVAAQEAGRRKLQAAAHPQEGIETDRTAGRQPTFEGIKRYARQAGEVAEIAGGELVDATPEIIFEVNRRRYLRQ
jgi:hypothetical protein